jgi:Membrane-bound toxin component of toxin-antitoxin system
MSPFPERRKAAMADVGRLKDGVTSRRGVKWDAMVRHRRLRLSLHPSRIGCAAMLAACAMASMVLANLPWAVMAPGMLLVLAVLAAGLWRCTGRGLPALLHIGLDRRITVTGCDGRSRAGAILDDSYVGAWLTTIVWKPDGCAWWRPARTIVVLPDMLSREESRQLRVALRYGRAAIAGGTSDEHAA